MIAGQTNDILTSLLLPSRTSCSSKSWCFLPDPGPPVSWPPAIAGPFWPRNNWCVALCHSFTCTLGWFLLYICLTYDKLQLCKLALKLHFRSKSVDISVHFYILTVVQYSAGASFLAVVCLSVDQRTHGCTLSRRSYRQRSEGSCYCMGWIETKIHTISLKPCRLGIFPRIGKRLQEGGKGLQSETRLYTQAHLLKSQVWNREIHTGTDTNTCIMHIPRDTLTQQKTSVHLDDVLSTFSDDACLPLSMKAGAEPSTFPQ